MLLRNKIILLILCFSIDYVNAQNSHTMCRADEDVLFSCAMSNQKMLSICSKNSNEFVTYRYGNYQKIELTYPKKAIAATTAFKYSHYFRYQTDYFRLIFTIDNYQYEVFRDYDGTTKPSVVAGIIVTNIKTKKEYDNRCKKINKDNIGTLYNYLPCDKDGVFGCKIDD